MTRILFITATRIGDAILFSGPLAHLARTHPGAHITVACGPLAAPLFRAAPFVTDVIVMAKRPGGRHWLDLWRRTAGRRWDLVVDMRGVPVTEDDLAYLRLERDYTNALLCELPNGHFGDTIARQFLFDVFNQLLFKELCNSKDERIAGIAAKAIKEVNYHVRHSTDWVLRLGDGTEESHDRIQDSFNRLWEYTGDLFVQDEHDRWCVENGIGPDLDTLLPRWKQKVSEVLTEATLTYVALDDKGKKQALPAVGHAQ